jgi:Fe-S cluster biogenesis protein NfuA
MDEKQLMIDKIQRIIEEDINPYLAMHSGGCELLDIEDGVVTLRMYGGCSGCPSSQITLFNGILPILKEKAPEVVDVLLG